MKKKISSLLLTLLVLVSACSDKAKQHQRNHNLTTVAAHGYLVPADSLTIPKVVPVGTLTISKPSVKPTVTPANTNIHPATHPTATIAGSPIIKTPGFGSLAAPKKILAIDSSFAAGIPEIVIAKDMVNRDQNSQNFSSFKKLQGLKHANIKCLLEDKLGNLWLGTNGGGISKYDGKTFTHYTEKEGLSGNTVWDIIQDKSGNIWIATYGGGVCRYDGKKMTRFTTKEGLNDDNIWGIFEDRAGNLWFSTNSAGVVMYDGKYFTMYGKQQGFSDNTTRNILQDTNGNLWFATAGDGLIKFDGTKFSHFTTSQGLSSNDVWSLAEDRSGALWIGTNGRGVCKYDGKCFINYTTKEGLNNNTVLKIIEDAGGNLWFGTYGGGICSYNFENFIHYTENEGLSQNDVWDILQDKSGNLWFGTNGGGVCKFSGNKFTHFTKNEGLLSNLIRCIVKDNNNNLWCGSDEGIMRYDGKSFTNFTTKQGLANNEILSGLKDRIGNLWFGSNGGGVCKYDGKGFVNINDKAGLINNHIWCIEEDKNDNIWFGTYQGACKYDGKNFTYFTTREGLSHNTVKSILEDRKGNIWFGTGGGGITKYNGKSFEHFNKKNGFNNNDIRVITEDKNGIIWFGTFGNGLYIYNGKQFINLTEKEGLSNNFVFSILQDKHGNLVFGTRFGLSKLTTDKYNDLMSKIKSGTINDNDVLFENYSYEDGYLGIGCNGNSLCEDQNGTIWIGSNDRLTLIHKKEKQASTDLPNIQLSGIELFNESIGWNDLLSAQGKVKDTSIVLGNGVIVSKLSFKNLSRWYNLPESLSLSYTNNFLTFNFIGITMNQPKNVKYQYMLTGIDNNWSAVSNKTSAPYGNLPSGNYTFKVKAMNSSGVWGAPVEYNFAIRPPFWETWWFRALMSLVSISLVFLYIKMRERKLKTRQRELEIKIREATFEIKEQKDVIEIKHKEITDSINYAERIQRSFLATKDFLDKHLNDYFILFKPKEVVSGDFYWATNVTVSLLQVSGSEQITNNNKPETKDKELFCLVTADSTGHGVPGAIMSLLNTTSLEKATELSSDPAEILNITRRIIIDRLKKDGSADGGKDGMDCSICVYDFKQLKLWISAAHNPVWIIRDSEVIEIKADKMPVGKHDKQDIPFTTQEISLQKNDLIYTLTDGFPDQFGGERGKKFMSKNLRELLIKNATLPMSQQKELLEKTFLNWVGNLEQTDDVTIIGIKI